MKKGVNNQIPGAFSLVPLVVPLVLRGDWNCSYICNTLGILELTAQATIEGATSRIWILGG